MGCGASASDRYQEPKNAEIAKVEAPAKVPATSSTSAAAKSATPVSRQAPETSSCETSPCETLERTPQQTLESAAVASSEDPLLCSPAPQSFPTQEGMPAAAAEETPAAETSGVLETAEGVPAAAAEEAPAVERSGVLETAEDAAHVDGGGMLADATAQHDEDQATVLQAPAIQESPVSDVVQEVAAEVPKVPEVRVADTPETTSMVLESDVVAEGTSGLATELFEQLAEDANPVSTSHSSALLELDRSAGESLGVAVREADAVLLITWTGKAGLIPSWSAANPDRAVRPGHRIIQANAASGAAVDLLSACRESAPVVLEVDRTHKAVKASVTSDGVAHFCRHQLEQLCLKHDQEAIKQLDKRMDTYKGREVALYKTYCKKYGEEAKDPEFCANSTDDILL